MPVENLIVGEISTAKKAQVQKWVSEVLISLTMDGASQLSFVASDRNLEMHNAGYFVVRRPVHYAGLDYEFEVAAVEVEVGPGSPPQIHVEARSRAIQQLKRQKGAMVWNNISPTSLAAMLAGEMELGFYGETSAVVGAISRTQTEDTDESSWDVLQRLASELQFVVFEAGGILYFASEKNLVSAQPNITLTWPSPENDPFYLHSLNVRRSDDDVWGASLDATIGRTNATQIRPGMTISLKGVSYFESRRFLITAVEWEDSVPDPVSVTARMIEASSDVGCETQTFQRGDSGDCVKRIQEAVNVPQTGVFDEATETAVIDFQNQYHLDPTGIVDQATWAAIASPPFVVETQPVSSAGPGPGGGPGPSHVVTEVGTPSNCRRTTLRFGDSGQCVRLIQQFLGLPDDGIFAVSTERAVKSFQGRNGMTNPSGIWGVVEWRIMMGEGSSGAHIT